MQQVGPGGHFFGCDHTMERYKSAFYEPFLSDWQNQENWQLAGAKDATVRATETWQKALQEFKAHDTGIAIVEELQEYLTKRKEQLGKEEPVLAPVPLS